MVYHLNTVEGHLRRFWLGKQFTPKYIASWPHRWGLRYMDYRGNWVEAQQRSHNVWLILTYFGVGFIEKWYKPPIKYWLVQFWDQEPILQFSAYLKTIVTTEKLNSVQIHIFTKNANFLLKHIHWKKILDTNEIVCLFYASVKRKQSSAIITCRIERISRTTHFQKHPV